MLDAARGLLACPVCAGALDVAERPVRCRSAHSFDVARQGYVNLLGSTPPANADTAAMVAAREREGERLPVAHPGELGAEARQQREAAGDGGKIVQRALQWVRRDFAYTLATPLPGRHLADEFLFDQQAGFCEHFSSSFAITQPPAFQPPRPARPG